MKKNIGEITFIIVLCAISAFFLITVIFNQFDYQEAQTGGCFIAKQEVPNGFIPVSYNYHNFTVMFYYNEELDIFFTTALEQVECDD